MLFADVCVVLLRDVCSVADSIVSFCVCANESVIIVCAIWFLCVAACWRVTVTVPLVFMGSDVLLLGTFASLPIRLCIQGYMALYQGMTSDVC